MADTNHTGATKRGQRWANGGPAPLTPEYLRELFNYDAETGELRWKSRPAHHFHVPGWADFWNRHHAGKIAGQQGPDGRTRVTLRSKPHLAHRLIWAIVHGESPEQIDHINGDPADNRLCNLRACNQAQNQQNRGKRKTNKSGYKGVCWSAQARKWRASITVNSKHVHLGFFADPKSAHEAYCRAADDLHGAFAHRG